jgi:CBS domain-containing protein
MKVKDVMTRGAESVSPDDSLETAARRMREAGVGALAVCEQGSVVGLITDRDIVVRSIAEGKDPSGTDVRGAMTPQVIDCREDDDLVQAATRMEQGAVRRAVVLDADGVLVGMLSVDDVALHSQELAGEIVEHARAPERPVAHGPWPWWE